MNSSFQLNSILLISAILVGSTGCGGDTHESLTTAAMDQMDAFAAVLEGVTDIDSANAAKSKIEAIGATLKDLQERGKKLPDPSEEEKERLNEMMKERQAAFTKRMMEAMGNLAMKPELMLVLSEAMDSMKEFN